MSPYARYALIVILAVVLGSLLGWFVNTQVESIKLKAYLEGCITHGGDPIKCLGTGIPYSKE